MKKYISAIAIVLSLAFTACQKDFEPGGTAVEKMAGEWWVTKVEMQNGNEVGDRSENYRINTYNTAANVATEMWLDDDSEEALPIKLKVSVDYKNKSFKTDGFIDTAAKKGKVKITDGKVLLGKATTPSGMPADSIVYNIEIEGNAEVYRIAGFRRTGFPNDDF